MFAVDRAEQPVRAVGACGRTKEQKPAGVQSIVKRRASLLLEFTVEIDQEVAAGNEVDI
jgi:hypothetical protein